MMQLDGVGTTIQKWTGEYIRKILVVGPSIFLAFSIHHSHVCDTAQIGHCIATHMSFDVKSRYICTSTYTY